MAFIDEITLTISAGRGGDGVVRWRHEKAKPMSGPGGGNGGPGGDVYIVAVQNLSALDTYQYKKDFHAENGQPGGDHGKQGAAGNDLVFELPIGSVITMRESGFVWSLDQVGQKIKILSGGRGGLGNEWFKSSRNVSPTESTPGDVGESGVFHIELRLIADVGLLGLPSAGKSSLLNALTNSRSKVGAYDFTTLEPHLGVLPGGYIMADIPGIIEGAHLGRGLGLKFLRHIQRTRILLHLVSCEYGDALIDRYTEVRNELMQYGNGLDQKPEIILLTKTDMVTEVEIGELRKKIAKQTDRTVLTVSLFDDTSIGELQSELSKILGK